MAPEQNSSARTALRQVRAFAASVRRFSSLVSHGLKFCPREPLNTTQQIREAL